MLFRGIGLELLTYPVFEGAIGLGLLGFWSLKESLDWGIGF